MSYRQRVILSKSTPGPTGLSISRDWCRFLPSPAEKGERLRWMRRTGFAFFLITNTGRRGAVPYGLRLFPLSATDLAFLVGRWLAAADNKGVRFHNAV